jgi:hypothetical protein
VPAGLRQDRLAGAGDPPADGRPADPVHGGELGEADAVEAVELEDRALPGGQLGDGAREGL